MPINFVTGLPRQGKTLFAFIQIQERAKKENRPVFYCNIPEVTLEGWTEIDHPDKWMECPNDSIIVVDELQDFWGSASSGARVPEPILELSKHGKRGIDFYFITQDPTLVHNTPRKLTETHWYVVRAFGTENALAYKFKGMQTDPGKVVQKAEKYPWRYPKEAFGKKDNAGNWITKPWYKSADVHNIKRQIPLKLVAIPFLIFLAIGAVWFAVSSVLSFGDRMKTSAGAVAPGATSAVARAPGQASVAAPGQGGPAVIGTVEYVKARQPRLPDFPNTAPVYDQITQPTEAPYPAACVQMGKRCECYTQQATMLRVSFDVCMQIVSRGYFMDWKRPESEPPQPSNRRDEPSHAAAPSQPPVVINMPAQGQAAPQQNGYLEALALRNSQVRGELQR
ncbi:zonular occludens toxin domain-containing protein [Acidovorax sp. SUPP2825]|uniref:zonular occludens toxin domain-containing protein n=1 Tax=Acidovorax sp. SUPP2825 TaxID=2920879 RepID=UPI0023DE2DE7|nr:zonular occludens toxin domain-containing protein [Acidovorax sp. SUPP2825]GKS96154.1 zonular occludens toxin [Acidovorax sp. SUPP2825]